MALFFAALNIVLGMQAAGAGNDWKTSYGFLVSIIIVVVIVLEILAYLKRAEKHSLPPNFHMESVGDATFQSSLAKGTSFPCSRKKMFLSVFIRKLFSFSLCKIQKQYTFSTWIYLSNRILIFF